MIVSRGLRISQATAGHMLANIRPIEERETAQVAAHTADRSKSNI